MALNGAYFHNFVIIYLTNNVLSNKKKVINWILNKDYGGWGELSMNMKIVEHEDYVHICVLAQRSC